MSRLKVLWYASPSGMSTIPEVVTARHCGMRVLALSLITDMATMDYRPAARTNHEEILETAKWRAGVMQELVAGVVDRIGSD